MKEIVDSEGNIIKIDSGGRADPTSLVADSDAGTHHPLSTDFTIPQGPDLVNDDA